MTKKIECECQAAIDVALLEPEGLVGLDTSDAKIVIRHLARRLPLEKVVQRIGHAPDPLGLLGYLPHIYGFTGRDLRPVARAVLAQHSDFDGETIAEFGNIYWTAAFEDTLKARRYRASWVVTKLAICGKSAFNKRHDTKVLPHYHLEPVGLFPSPDCGRRMIQELYAALEVEGIVSGDLSAPVYTPAKVGHAIRVAEAIGGYDPEMKTYKVHGLQALAIAGRGTQQAMAAMEPVALAAA